MFTKAGEVEPGGARGKSQHLLGERWPVRAGRQSAINRIRCGGWSYRNPAAGPGCWASRRCWPDWCVRWCGRAHGRNPVRSTRSVPSSFAVLEIRLQCVVSKRQARPRLGPSSEAVMLGKRAAGTGQAIDRRVARAVEIPEDSRRCVMPTNPTHTACVFLRWSPVSNAGGRPGRNIQRRTTCILYKERAKRRGAHEASGLDPLCGTDQERRL
jgi:hypothetical protein